MQTDEQKHKDTYEHGRQGEDEDGAGRVSRPGERDRQKERDAGRAGLSGETESVDTKGGSLLFLQCGQEAQYPTDPLDVTVSEICSAEGYAPLCKETDAAH